MSRILQTATLSVLAAVWLAAQPPTAPLTFEVASIKPSAGDEHRIGIQILPGGGLRVSGAPLRMLLTVAYGVREFQISGGPGWINSDRYDILAKPERGTASDNAPSDPRPMSDSERKTVQEQMQQRLQSLLADRFQVTIHRETKEAPVYALVVAKGGSKLQPSERKEGNAPRGPMMRLGRGEINGQGVKLEMLATSLSNILGRSVVDQTGLSGNFDVKLQWTPDLGQSPTPFGGAAPPPGVQAPPPPDPNGPSIFTALQEQLGLRLESQKGPVEMIVIDHVEKPSEN